MTKVTVSALSALWFVTMVAGDVAAKPPKDAVQKAFELLERGTRAGDFDVRATAVAGLGKAPKKDAILLLVDALKDPQWKVRRAAIEALRELKDKRWEAELGRAACDPMVEEAEVMSLLAVLKPDASMKLLQHHLGTKECVRPERYVTVLSRAEPDLMLAAFRGAEKAKAGVVKEIFQQAVPALPLPAALPLYKAGFAKYPADVQATLIKRFADEKVEGDLSFVAAVLKQKESANHFVAAELLGLRGNAAGRAVLTAAATGADEALRLRALKALEPIAGAAEFELVKPIIKVRETPYDTLIAAYRVYVKSGSNKLAAYLEKELDNTDAPQRAAAVYFLGEVKGRAAIPELHKLASAGAEIVRRAAIDAIGRLGQRESIPVLRDALARETSRDWQIALLEALTKIKDAEIIPVVRFYVNDTDATVRLAAVRALAAVPDKSGLADLEIAARDRQKEVRELALLTMLNQDPEARYEQFVKALEWIDVALFRAFVKRHGDLVRRHVEAALGHGRDDLRAAAFRALEGLPRATRVAMLAGLVANSTRPAQKAAALDAVVALEGKGAIDLLVSLSSGGDELMRVRAIAHLGRLGHKGAEANLLGWLDDPSEKIKVAAAAAVLRL